MEKLLPYKVLAVRARGFVDLAMYKGCRKSLHGSKYLFEGLLVGTQTCEVIQEDFIEVPPQYQKEREKICPGLILHFEKQNWTV